MGKSKRNLKDRKKVFSLNRSHFKWDYFRAGGKGGQAQNTKDTGVRCTHEPSGAVGEARDTANQLTNKRNAFKRCCLSKKFQAWCRAQALDMRPIEDVVDEMMAEENIKVEKRVNGKWVEVDA